MVEYKLPPVMNKKIDEDGKRCSKSKFVKQQSVAAFFRTNYSFPTRKSLNESNFRPTGMTELLSDTLGVFNCEEPKSLVTRSIIPNQNFP